MPWRGTGILAASTSWKSAEKEQSPEARAVWAGLVLLYREEKQGTHLRHMLEASVQKRQKRGRWARSGERPRGRRVFSQLEGCLGRTPPCLCPACFPPPSPSLSPAISLSLSSGSFNSLPLPLPLSLPLCPPLFPSPCSPALLQPPEQAAWRPAVIGAGPGRTEGATPPSPPLMKPPGSPATRSDVPATSFWF